MAACQPPEAAGTLTPVEIQADSEDQEDDQPPAPRDEVAEEVHDEIEDRVEHGRLAPSEESAQALPEFLVEAGPFGAALGDGILPLLTGSECCFAAILARSLDELVVAAGAGQPAPLGRVHQPHYKGPSQVAQRTPQPGARSEVGLTQTRRPSVLSTWPSARRRLASAQPGGPHGQERAALATPSDDRRISVVSVAMPNDPSASGRTD